MVGIKKMVLVFKISIFCSLVLKELFGNGIIYVSCGIFIYFIYSIEKIIFYWKDLSRLFCFVV